MLSDNREEICIHCPFIRSEAESYKKYFKKFIWCIVSLKKLPEDLTLPMFAVFYVIINVELFCIYLCLS